MRPIEVCGLSGGRRTIGADRDPPLRVHPPILVARPRWCHAPIAAYGPSGSALIRRQRLRAVALEGVDVAHLVVDARVVVPSGHQQVFAAVAVRRVAHPRTALAAQLEGDGAGVTEDI